MKFLSEKNLHTFFDAGIILKLVSSVSEIVIGFLALFLNEQLANRIFYAIFGDEINEPPFRTIWNVIVHGFAQISNNSQGFLAFIFLSHGFVKLILIAG